MDKTQYAYTKTRSAFGRACAFSDRPAELDVHLPQDPEVAKQFIRRNPVNMSCQDSERLSEHETNTSYVELEVTGINHTEGGWPKDIGPNDVDLKTRYRKKTEKEEAFVVQVSRQCQEMEHNILQNNAIEIYKHYFDEHYKNRDYPPVFGAKVINNYRDPSNTKRPVAQVTWHPDGTSRIAVAHCFLDFQRQTPFTSVNSYVWRTEDILNPDQILVPDFPVLCLRYNPKDSNILAGGQHNGQVVIWDLRKGNKPSEKSSIFVSHRDPVYDVTWVQSKTGTECFSTSTDGQVLWWDTRNMNEPIDQLWIDATKQNERAMAEGGTCLEFDITVPTKFMVGTETGSVFVCSRRAKTPGEKVVTVYPKAHIGPVYALRRNQIYTKCFLTVGDWCAKIWSEDCKESPIVWTTKGMSYLTDGTWSPTRASVFFLTKMDGSFDVWDLIYQQKKAEYSVKVSDSPLLCVNAHDHGQLVCVGTEDGTAVMLQLSDGLWTPQRNERAIFYAILERETKREKIMEGKERERKLHLKQTAEDEEKKPVTQVMPVSLEDQLEEISKEFFNVIDKERKRLERETLKFKSEADEVGRPSDQGSASPDAETGADHTAVPSETMDGEEGGESGESGEMGESAPAGGGAYTKESLVVADKPKTEEPSAESESVSRESSVETESIDARQAEEEQAQGDESYEEYKETTEGQSKQGYESPESRDSQILF